MGYSVLVKNVICSLTTMHKVFLRLQIIHIKHRLDDNISYLGNSTIVAMSVTMLVSFRCCSVNAFVSCITFIKINLPCYPEHYPGVKGSVSPLLCTQLIQW